jgi:hypothetical protein
MSPLLGPNILLSTFLTSSNYVLPSGQETKFYNHIFAEALSLLRPAAISLLTF